jgi:hypothetical protein
MRCANMYVSTTYSRQGSSFEISQVLGNMPGRQQSGPTFETGKHITFYLFAKQVFTYMGSYFIVVSARGGPLIHNIRCKPRRSTGLMTIIPFKATNQPNSANIDF